MIVGIAIIIWSIWFLPTRRGSTVFLGLFILSFLVGGGIGQIAFFFPAWAFSTRINKPLFWWRKVLPEQIQPFFAKFWPVSLVLSTIVMLIGLEIAIFGIFPGLESPQKIQDIAMLFVLAASILYVVTFIAGLGHDIRRMNHYIKQQSINF